MAWKTLIVVSATLLVISHGYTLQQKIALSMKARRLPNEICGESSGFAKRIIGGKNASLGKYPWMVAIGYTNSSEGPYWDCGGTLITDTYVVTASHCVHPKFLGNKTVSVVRVGDLNLDDKVDDKATPEDIDVEEVIRHPNYHTLYHTNDIAIIKLKTRVEFTALKKPICLPLPAEFHQKSFVGKPSTVIGWGITERGPTTALEELTVNIKDSNSCKRNYTGNSQWEFYTDRVFCASAPGKDACRGDSGGPLMVLRSYTGEAKLYLLGVVSFGPRFCILEGYPGVYTRVSYFMNWILDTLDI